MTRINVGIHPTELHGKQLIAEHKEITRIPNAVMSGRANLVGIPSEFTLNTGHVRFFYNKLGYLSKRYSALLTECRRRGYAVTDKTSAFRKTPENSELFGDYTETERDRQLLIERIKQRGFDLLSIE